jgi:hypothetical protein
MPAGLLDSLGLAGVRPEQIAFWTGAGISFAAPTCAPGGYDLVERALDAFFLPGTLDRIRRVYGALRLARTHPRLETVLDVVRRVHGPDALADVLRDLRVAPPNGLHQFFAAHLACGGRHVTANFDTCVERSGGVGVVHIHGDFGGGMDTLGATLTRIQRGFPADLENALGELLESVAAVVVVGCSGSDAFDVEPFLRGLRADALGHRTLVWLRYAPGPAAAASSGDERIARHFDAVAHTGIDCAEVGGDPMQTLAGFADAWGVPFAVDAAPCAASWTLTVPVDDGRRRRASLELAAMMGVHQEVSRLLAPCDARDTDEWGIAAQTAWAQGRYREARAIWRCTLAGDDGDTRARLDERVGATLWIEGRLWRANRYLRRAVASARAAGVTGEPLWLLAETQGRVLAHMQRRPLLRCLVTRRRRQAVTALLPPRHGDGYRSRGVHLDARLAGVAASLAAPVVEPAAGRSEPANTFSEAEALHAMLNYRHAALRRRAAAGRASADEYRRQRDDFLAIGAGGDAPRVMTIPGSEAAFTFAELRRDLESVELAPWPRLLLMARFVRQRCRLGLL